MMFPWKTVGMHDPSSSSLATYAQSVDDCLRMDSSRPALMTCCTTWFSSTHLRSSSCPSRVQWRMLEWSSCMNRPLLHVSTWLLSRTLRAEFPFSRCFWQATQLRPFLIATVSTRIQASQWAVPTLLRRMAGVAAMCMRSTHGCGSLDGASHNWVDSMWRKLLRDRRLPEMKGSSVDWRLVDNRRQKELDYEWIMVVNM